MNKTMNGIFSKQQEINLILKDVEKIAEVLWQRGWYEKNGGNISIQLPSKIKHEYIHLSEETILDVAVPELKGQCFYMTGTGKRMYDIAESATDNGLFIQLNESGDAYYLIKDTENKVKPTSEFPAHLGIHNMIAERGTQETIVMHTHATEMVALTQNPSVKTTKALNKILWGMHCIVDITKFYH